MKHFFSAVCSLVLAMPVFGSGEVLTKDGVAGSEIVISGEAAHRQIKYAAREFSFLAKSVTGGEIPVVTRAGDSVPGRIRIVLGTPFENREVAEFAKANSDAFKRIGNTDGFIIKSDGRRIVIEGKRKKGVMNGVYRFFEKNTDLIFANQFDFGMVYGVNPTLVNVIDALVDVPVLTGRFWTNHGTPQLVWQARLLNTFSRPLDGNMNPRLYALVSETGDMSELSGTLGLGLVAKYYESDPAIFPLVSGRRVNYHDCQLCFMNPRTLELFCREAERIVASNPTTVTSYTLGLGDNSDVCECALCSKEIVLPDGRTLKPSDRNFRSTQYALFSNAVSDYLTSKFPHVKPIPATAYLFTAEAPAVAARGGGPFYCPYIKNHKKPVYDDSVNAVWHRKAEDFKKGGMPVSGLYEYYLCSSTPRFYHAVSEVAQKDIKYYLPHLRTVYLDTPYGDDSRMAYEVSGIEFYVMSRLFWNPETDVAEARREYCRRAYREAARPMTEYYERLASNYNSDPAGCFWNDDPVSACRHYIVDAGLSDFVKQKLSEAESLAVHPNSKELIKRHRAHIEGLISKAEKMPKRVSLDIPMIKGAPVSFDIDSPEWRNAARIDSFTEVANASRASARPTRAAMRQDIRNLYILFEMKDANAPKLFEDALKRDDKSMFDWCNCVEMFIDGGLRRSGSYYHLAFMINGRRHSGQGPTPLDPAPAWTVQTRHDKESWTALVTIPLSEIGVNISQGNTIGAMFVCNGGAWNGGQHHSPTGFQNLVFELK